ncbi:MAG: hypothetical protein MUO73_01020 [Thermoplasmata archaeon]|nr:hypothetical protein [Thermoplasmata archaeon]
MQLPKLREPDVIPLIGFLACVLTVSIGFYLLATNNVLGTAYLTQLIYGVTIIISGFIGFGIMVTFIAVGGIADRIDQLEAQI